MRYASYRRSGSHFFGLLLKSRFYGSQEVYGIMEPSHGHPFQGVNAEGMCDWADLFIGHPSNPTPEADVYLVRDGRDVMASLWRLLGKEPFSAFLRAVLPNWYVTTLTWKRHPCIVHYEQLLANADRVLDQIAERFDLRSDGWGHACRKPIGYHPSQEKLPSPFTQDDHAYFDSVVKDRWTLSE